MMTIITIPEPVRGDVPGLLDNWTGPVLFEGRGAWKPATVIGLRGDWIDLWSRDGDPSASPGSVAHAWRARLRDAVRVDWTDADPDMARVTPAPP